jgi:hypothetical protein
MEEPMSLVAITGKVSHLNRLSSVSGGGGGTAVSTSYQTTLRVDGRHVKVNGSMSWVADDDYIAIVGIEDEGVLDPLAIRNDSSGYESYAETKSYTFAIVCLILGFFTFFITTAIGAWLIFGIQKQKKLNAEAKQMLHEMPRTQASEQQS